MPQVVPPQSRLRLASSPINDGAFWCGINSYIKPALKGEVDRLSYEVQQWKKDSMGTRV